MLFKEPNYRRKAQRVDLPLLLQIEGKSFKTKDWSLAGLGILNLDLPFEKDKEIECSLVLPLEGANFVLPATIVQKNQRGNIIGCEFRKLAPKNKRVLRRFIELAIEGQIDNVEDCIAAYSEPVIETPISEALSLEKKEAHKIKKTFLKKSLAYIFVGLVAALLIGYIAKYNLQYKIFATGVVTGSFIKVTANNGGILDKFHVKNHDTVEKGMVLFDLVVTENVRRPKASPADLKALESDAKAMSILYVSDVIDALKELKDSKRREHKNAEALHIKRLITKKDLNIIYNNYLKATINYERERDHVRKENERRRSRSASIKEKINELKSTTYETVTVSSIKRRISTIEGIVYRIEHSEGEFVHPDQTVMILQTREKPYIVLKLHSRDIYKVKVNDTALIYSKYGDKSHRGRVTQIGYASVNADATISQETSLNTSLVKIEFNDDHIEFPLNSRVEVRIKREWFQD